MRRYSPGLAALTTFASLLAGARATETADCRCFPGDACWPTEETWTSFNASVNGNLIRTVPIGSVCHDPHYDEKACEAVKAKWRDTDIQYV